jgi:uncharacterized protein
VQRGLTPPRVEITGGFWAGWRERNRDVSLAHGARMLREAGNLRNLQLAAGTAHGEYTGPVFMDSDVYKWLEAVCSMRAIASSASGT